jgi:hypothetical protein
MFGNLHLVLILRLIFLLLITIIFSEAIHLNTRKNIFTNLIVLKPLIKHLGGQS